MVEVEQFWQKVQLATLPVPVVDVSDTFDRIRRQTLGSGARFMRTTNGWRNAGQFRVVSKRTAWVFVYHANTLLVPELRVPCTDHEDALDKVEDIHTALATMASRYDCTVTYRNWIVWSGRPSVMSAWNERMQ